MDDQQNFEAHVSLLAQITAQNLLLRGLYTKWALEKEDPLDFIDRSVLGMIASVDGTKRETTENAEFQDQIEEMAREELKGFLQNVRVRIRAIAG